MTPYGKFKERWPLWLVWALVIVLVLMPMPFMLGRWAFQPVLMIFASVIATQIGSRYGQTTLNHLVRTLTYKDPDGAETAQVSEEEKRKLNVLKEAIETRLQPEKKEGHGAVDSYLNQVAGSWAMVILIIGLAIMLSTRPYLGIQNPPWMGNVIIIALLLIIGLLIWIATKGIVGSKSIIIYCGHNKIYPPNGALTIFRAAVLIIYGCLVFAAYWPKPLIVPNVESNLNNNNMASILTTNIQNKTAPSTTNTSSSFNTK
jgi:hypothetical protein